MGYESRMTATHENRTGTADVIVVGGGGTGMAAALSAAEAGADVLLLEMADELGGTTAMAIGSYSVAETDMQADAGIEDSIDAHFTDIGKFVDQAAESPRHVNLGRKGSLEGRDDLALRRVMVELGPNTFEWLQEKGLEYNGPHPEPPHRVPRMHNVQPSTDAYRDVLGGTVHDSDVDVRCGVTVETVLTEGGSVVGVRTADGDTYGARGGVVLATGGFVADEGLREEFTTDHTAPPVAEYGSGAGHRMAREVGAELINMDIQWLSFRVGEPLWTEPNVPALTDAGGVLVSPEGDRYVNELVDYDQLFTSTLEVAGGACYVVFDAGVAETFSSWPNYVSTFPGAAYGYVDDYLETDYMTRADNPTGLADDVGADPATLSEAIGAYNDAAEGERVDRYGRTAFDGPLDSAPYYALGPVRPYSLITDGGVRVNTRLEALDADGSPIEGLYAAGDTAGGPLRMGHGHHHLWLFNSGRVAGREAAERTE